MSSRKLMVVLIVLCLFTTSLWVSILPVLYPERTIKIRVNITKVFEIEILAEERRPKQ